MADISIDEFCQPAAGSSPRKGGTVNEDARAHFERGVAWVQRGAYEQALEAWKQALRIAPDMAEAYAGAGSVYMAMGCWQEAVRNYQKAMKADPYLLESYYGLGSAYGRMGEYGRAIDVYERALQLPPESRIEPQPAVVASPHAPAADAFQDRLRADNAGFDFSALLSSPAERRQALREEPDTLVSAPLPEPLETNARFIEIERETVPETPTSAVPALFLKSDTEFTETVAEAPTIVSAVPGEVAPALSLEMVPAEQTTAAPEPSRWSPILPVEPALEEVAPEAVATVPALRQESTLSAPRASSGGSNMGWNHHNIADVTLVELGAVEPNNETDGATAPGAAVRDQRARTALVVTLIILGCMGGKAAVSAINEARDRAAYLAATREAQLHRGSVSQPTSSRGAQ